MNTRFRLAVLSAGVISKGPLISKPLVSEHLHPSARTNAVRERRHQILGLGVRPTRKQHGHLVLAGLDREANVLQPTVDGVDAGRLSLIDRSQIFVAADARLVDDLAVER